MERLKAGEVPMESETVLNVCPQCGEETARGSPPNYLLWCDDPGDACTCYICEACGYIFIPSGKCRKNRYVEEGRNDPAEGRS